jgi:peptidoglycan/xylan/chitin deacetylase (PgdA/CDA1 family)
VLQQAAAITREDAPFPRLFRPPFGSFNASTLSLLRGLHMLMVLWSVDTGDYRRPGTKAIVQRALAGARPGAIILLHDAGGDRSQTIAALPLVIRRLRHRHLRLVTIPRLVLDDPPPRGQALPQRLAGD